MCQWMADLNRDDLSGIYQIIHTQLLRESYLKADAPRQIPRP
jgi:hypothetical protein